VDVISSSYVQPLFWLLVEEVGFHSEQGTRLPTLGLFPLQGQRSPFLVQGALQVAVSIEVTLDTKGPNPEASNEIEETTSDRHRPMKINSGRNDLSAASVARPHLLALRVCLLQE